jgi:hypothetical protein
LLRSPHVAWALCALLLTGCTATFTYNRLDWLIPWYVDGYVDLNREQRQILEGQLEPLLKWHREKELARYIDMLDRIERELGSPVTADTVQAWIDDITVALERTEASMLSLALDFSESLSDAQMAEFTANLWQRQSDYEEEFLDRSEEVYRRDSYDSLANFLRRFTGPLQSAQKERLRIAADKLLRFDKAWLEERSLWLKTLEPLLRREPGWQQRVQAAYTARKVQRTPRYREYLAHNLGVISEALAEVLNQLDSKQRKRLAREFDDLRSRLRELSATPRTAWLQPAATASRIA